MIIQNGYIRFAVPQTPEYDPDTGYPINSDREWGCRIPCQYVPVSRNYSDKVSGELYRTSSYDIYIEERSVDGGAVLLETLDGTLLGEFPVVFPEHLQAVGQVRLKV